MNSILISIKKWVASKGGWSHVIALGWALAIAAYAENTQFRTACNNLYVMLPSWAHETVLGLAGLLAWYKSWNKTQAGQNDTSSKSGN